MQNLKLHIEHGLNAPKYLILLEIIEDLEQLNTVYQRYPETFVKQETRERLGSILVDWTTYNDKKHKKVICLYQDPDSHARNDGWGGKVVYLAIVVKTATGYITIGQKDDSFKLD